MNHIETLTQLTLSNNPIAHLQLFVGASHFLQQPDVISFRFKGSQAANFMRIELTPMDVYTVVFGNIKTIDGFPQVVDRQEFTNVYCDDLHELFEQTTGLYLHM